MQAVIVQAAIEAVMAAIRAMVEADPPTEPHTRRSSPEEPHRPRWAGTVLRQPAFNWKGPDRYVELLNFEMEIAKVLQTRVHDVSDKEHVPMVKDV